MDWRRTLSCAVLVILVAVSVWEEPTAVGGEWNQEDGALEDARRITGLDLEADDLARLERSKAAARDGHLDGISTAVLILREGYAPGEQLGPWRSAIEVCAAAGGEDVANQFEARFLTRQSVAMAAVVLDAMSRHPRPEYRRIVRGFIGRSYDLSSVQYAIRVLGDIGGPEDADFLRGTPANTDFATHPDAEDLRETAESAIAMIEEREGD